MGPSVLAVWLRILLGLLGCQCRVVRPTGWTVPLLVGGPAAGAGVDLVGPGGLLTSLTWQVLETALEAEFSERLARDRGDRDAKAGTSERNGLRVKTRATVPVVGQDRAVTSHVDVLADVMIALDYRDDAYDVDAIVSELRADHGPVRLADVDPAAFTTITAHHAR